MFTRCLGSISRRHQVLATSRLDSLVGLHISGNSLRGYANGTSDGPAKPNRFFNKYQSNAKPAPASKHKGQGGHRNRQKGGSDQAKRPRIVTFEIRTGSDKAQTALKQVITNVHKISSSYKVNHVDPTTSKLNQVHLADVVNNLDLGVNGLLLIAPKQPGELPLVRTISVMDMVKSYSDELAALKEKELLQLGSTRAQRSIGQRMQAEKKKSATKIIAIAWSISASDLMNQKKNEIQNRIKKGEKFSVYIGERQSLYNARKSLEKENGVLNQLDTSGFNWGKMSEDALAVEMKKREMIFQKLEELLSEFECKFETSGSLDARMMVNVTPKATPKSEKRDDEEAPSAKELKRIRKAEKARELAEKAKQKATDADDLDSLYQFKIEN